MFEKRPPVNRDKGLGDFVGKRAHLGAGSAGQNYRLGGFAEKRPGKKKLDGMRTVADPLVIYQPVQAVEQILADGDGDAFSLQAHKP